MHPAMSDTAYRQKMFALIEGCSASGLTQKQWCAEHAITMHQFQYWNRHYKAARYAEAVITPAFIPVSLPTLPAQPIAELHYPDGRRLVLHAGIDALFLKTLLG